MFRTEPRFSFSLAHTGPRGGLLFEFLLTIAFMLAGAALWLGWKQRPDIFRHWGQPPREAARSADPARDSVWLQNRVRELLLRHGFRETDILKSYNREHREEGARWVESVLEITVKGNFDPAAFRRDLDAVLKKRDLLVRRESRQEKILSLELGDGSRLFECLLFRLPA